MSPASNPADPEDSPETRLLLVDNNRAFLRAAVRFLRRHHERNMLPGVGIVALTMLEGTAYRQVTLAAGADDLVRKEGDMKD
jgi:hypothetical protein